MSRVLVCGDRHWSDRKFLEDYLDKINIDTLIQGDCSGADRLAKDYAERKKIPCLSFPANWNEHGKRAGPLRNALMLKEGKPDFVVAFHDNIEESKGSKDMKNKAKKAGLAVVIASHERIYLV
ncbi:Hypothetical protein BRZCDTV_435 [Brazilian cedratvirus IHUMI]|uniref:YspA cpYpsA-related SLOG domain-containing protein n=1 Tax=Brazilian cedratvirus IHUMI TaxID=2126980 RepID=A0A2R8FFH8_9VIRU|nr:Hypothetical protein BRZCDTV_435 [Brazilian cedratvirus IHUMI]